jgi:hypothetical protein
VIPDPPPPFDLDMSAATRERIDVLGERAAQLGIAGQFWWAIDEIMEELRTRPRDWGEPFRNLSGFQMTARLAVHRKLRVVFSVHDRIPLVVLWSLSPTTGHPLAAPENGN